jgi:hypothetical protein
MAEFILNGKDLPGFLTPNKIYKVTYNSGSFVTVRNNLGGHSNILIKGPHAQGKLMTDASVFEYPLEYQNNQRAIGLYMERTGNSPQDWYKLTHEERASYREEIQNMYPNPYPDKNPEKTTTLVSGEHEMPVPKKKIVTHVDRMKARATEGPASGETLRDVLSKVSKTEQYTRVEDIDPSLAKLLLEANVKNRSLSSRLVESLVRDIKEGRWLLTHQGIALDTDGKLLDGQHRLTAIALSGATVKMNVTYNVTPDAFNVVDTNNRPRSQADIVKLQGGEKFQGVKMALVTGSMKVLARFGGTPSSVRWTTAELNKMLEVFSADAVHVTNMVAGQRGIGNAATVAAFALVYPLHPKFVEETLAAFKTKVGLTPQQAVIYRVIERADHNTDQNRMRKSVGILRAIKAALAGELISKIYVYKDKDLHEDATVRHFLYHRKRMGLPDIPTIAHTTKDE